MFKRYNMFSTIHTKRVKIDYDKTENDFYNNLQKNSTFSEETIDKFILNTYNDISIYERKKDQKMDYKSLNKSEELINVLDYFNKFYGYNEIFDFKDFIALEPITLEKINDNLWYAIYNGDDIGIQEKFCYKTSYGRYALNCSCSQDCGSLFLIKNIKTNIYFGVGSICIDKFIYKNFNNYINKLKRKINKISCSKCFKKTNENVLNKNKIKDKKFCNKCIKNVKVIFDIKYKEKEQFKIYGIRWDKDNKFWYINGAINEKLNEKVKDIEFIDNLQNFKFINDD